MEKSKMLAVRGMFSIYCKYICQNKIKKWFTGEKDKTVGFPAAPIYCLKCKHFNPKAKKLYQELGRLNV